MTGEGGEPGRRPLLSTEQLLVFGLSDVHTFSAWMSSFRNGYWKENSVSKPTGTSQSPSFCIFSVGSVRLDGLLPKGCLVSPCGTPGILKRSSHKPRAKSGSDVLLVHCVLGSLQRCYGAVLCGISCWSVVSKERSVLERQGCRGSLEAPFPCRALWERQHCFPWPRQLFLHVYGLAL